MMKNSRIYEYMHDKIFKYTDICVRSQHVMQSASARYIIIHERFR